MSIEYNGEHQICFWRKVFNPSPYVVGERYMTENPKFSWDDFHLIPLTRPFISASKPHYTLVTIPNSSKRVNITDFLSGGLTYESRTGEWEFAIDHDKWGNWVVSHHELEDFFNGSKMLVALNDDPTKIYEGRITLKEYDAGESYSTIKMAYNLDPEELPSTALANVMFRVRFLDKRNNVLQGALSGYGSAPYYPGAAPSEEGQTFKNWSPVPSGVTGNTDYTPVYDKTGGAYNGPPVRIEVVTPPTKTTYNDGEIIDYSGIVVKAYMENGEEWGEIPFSELQFPIGVASSSEANKYSDGNGTNAILITYTFTTTTFYMGNLYREITHYVYDNKTMGTNERTGRPYTLGGSDDGPASILLTRYNGSNYLAAVSGNNIHDYLYEYYHEDGQRPTIGWWLVGTSSATFNDKFKPGGWGSEVTNVPVSTVDPTGKSINDLHNTGQTLFVMWKRPSDKLELSSEFSINVELVS